VVANCVGARNYRSYVLLIFWVAATCTYGAAVAGCNVWHDMHTSGLLGGNFKSKTTALRTLGAHI